MGRRSYRRRSSMAGLNMIEHDFAIAGLIALGVVVSIAIWAVLFGRGW